MKLGGKKQAFVPKLLHISEPQLSSKDKRSLAHSLIREKKEKNGVFNFEKNG
jgi:hypothetical protein